MKDSDEPPLEPPEEGVSSRHRSALVRPAVALGDGVRGVSPGAGKVAAGPGVGAGVGLVVVVAAGPGADAGVGLVGGEAPGEGRGGERTQAILSHITTLLVDH